MARLLLILSLCFARSLSHSMYRSQIPNGYAVPNPCLVGQVWNAVGHMHWGSNFQQRNPFGQAFSRNGATWNREVCMQDSDGDGISNGEELGDPSCNWRPGAREETKPTGHPGICEPVGSPICAAQTFSCAPPQLQHRPQSPFQLPPPPQMQPRLQSPFRHPPPPQMPPRSQLPFEQPPPPLRHPPPMSPSQGVLSPHFPQVPLPPAPVQAPPRTASQQQAEQSQSWFGQGQFANWFSDFFNQNRPNQRQ